MTTEQMQEVETTEQRRARLAKAFADNTMTKQDAWDIAYLCMPVSGVYPIATIGIDDVISDVAEKYSNDADEIRPLAEDACDRIYRKWDSGDMESAAREHALDLVMENAIEDDIELIPIDEEEG